MVRDRNFNRTRLTMVQWCVQNHPHSSRLKLILQEMMRVAEGEHVAQGEHMVRGVPWTWRAMLRWSVDGRDYEIDMLHFSANQMPPRRDEQGWVDPAWLEKWRRDNPAEQEYLRAADVAIATIGAGRAGPILEGFGPWERDLRHFLELVGRDPETLPVLFMLDRAADPLFGVPLYAPELLVPVHRWPRCDHVITHSENGGEGVKETLDAAVRLWVGTQN